MRSPTGRVSSPRRQRWGCRSRNAFVHRVSRSPSRRSEPGGVEPLGYPVWEGSMSRRLSLAVLLIAGLAVASPAHAASHTVRVSMASFMFNPASVTVHVGDTVEWTYDETATTIPPGCE